MLERTRALLRDVPDFPQQGVLFRDLTPALADSAAFTELVDALAAGVPRASGALGGAQDGAGATHGGAHAVDVVLGVEARGFVLGAALARALGVGIALARKPGKLPAVAHTAAYELEYGATSIELPEGVLAPGARVAVVDDVLATGGTLVAACDLVEAAGAVVTDVVVALEIAALAGRDRLAGRPLRVLLSL